MQQNTCLNRRTLLGGAATLAVGAPLLAACAGGDEAAPAPDTGTVLARTGEIPVGGGKILESERIVITQPTEGEFKAFSAICTHQACVVTGVTQTIDCSCHQSHFALTDGSVQGGPAPEALPEIPIRIDGDAITAA
ncbi:Rieske (2Fe-2S) protein [Nocardioides sp. AE5]|uniref:QcrA and Rieske domain-containing protein n=1 Tax=Nocardioides sp. AE5 TaxID=2962573 RepID=UPI002881F72F|nr:Rieske (2Fe-2S) protein [Nocardioides sp. AE5]MDT0203650.1 Rieske (2Fe-2S) protein [Nocardioides sp. AE5]